MSQGHSALEGLGKLKIQCRQELNSLSFGFQGSASTNYATACPKNEGVNAKL
jgi:hypothetical protein